MLQARIEQLPQTPGMEGGRRPTGVTGVETKPTEVEVVARKNTPSIDNWLQDTRDRNSCRIESQWEQFNRIIFAQRRIVLFLSAQVDRATGTWRIK